MEKYEDFFDYSLEEVLKEITSWMGNYHPIHPILVVIRQDHEMISIRVYYDEFEWKPK